MCPRLSAIVLALPAFAGLTGCDPAFLERNPPVLEQRTVTVTHEVIDEPMVVGLVIDLHIPDPIDCREAQDRLLGLLPMFLPAGAEGQQLTVQNLAPGCAQASERRIDIPLWQREIAAASAQWGERHIRPVLIYANNADFFLPWGLTQDLQTLGSLGPNFERPAMTLGIGARRVTELGFQFNVAWTYASDPRLTDAVAGIATRVAPLRTREEAPWAPILPAEDLANVKALRWCDPIWDLAVSFPSDAVIDVTAETPPLVRPQIEPLWLEEGWAVEPVEKTMVLEVCLENCDRFLTDSVTGRLYRWQDADGCVLQAGPQAEAP